MEPRELIRELKGTDTQAEFAARIGVNQSTVSKLLLGKVTGGRAVVGGLLRAFPERRDDVVAAFYLPTNRRYSQFVGETATDGGAQ